MTVTTPDYLVPTDDAFNITICAKVTSTIRQITSEQNTKYALRAANPQAADRPAGSWSL
jgi:hypothetical protein